MYVFLFIWYISLFVLIPYSPFRFSVDIIFVRMFLSNKAVSYYNLYDINNIGALYYKYIYSGMYFMTEEKTP